MTDYEVNNLKKNYIFTCPHCNSNLDFTKEIRRWKLSLILAVDILKEIKEIINEK